MPLLKDVNAHACFENQVILLSLEFLPKEQLSKAIFLEREVHLVSVKLHLFYQSILLKVNDKESLVLLTAVVVSYHN